MSDRQRIERAIQTLQSQRGLLSSSVIDITLNALQAQLMALDTSSSTFIAFGQERYVTVLAIEPQAFDQNILEKAARHLINSLQNAQLHLWQYSPTLIIASFGPSLETSHHAEAAVKLALQIPSILQDFEILSLRYGIHTAPIRLEDSLTLNDLIPLITIAALLVQNADAEQILISHDSYRTIQGVFNVVPLSPITLSPQKLIEAYWVESAKKRAFPIENFSIAGVEVGMIGRDAELQALKNRFNQTFTNHQAQIVTIIGVQGVGKSRLLHEFAIWQELLLQQIWYSEGQATPELSTLPYGLVRQILCFRFQIYDYDSPETANEKWVAQITEVVGQAEVHQAHIIGHLLGFNFPHSPHLVGLRGNAHRTRQMAFKALAQFFIRLYQQTHEPIALHIEDLHWADAASLDLLSHLAIACQNIAFSIFSTARPVLFEEHPTWLADISYHTVLELHSFSEAHSRALADEFFKNTLDTPPSLVESIVQHAAGSPQYIEEVIRLMLDEGVIISGIHHWRLQSDRLHNFQFPAHLSDLAQARLYGLPPDERITLQWAAIAGRTFDDNIVVNLNPEDQPEIYDIQKALQSLVRRHMIIPREQGLFANTQTYIFRHDLLLEVAYNSIRVRQRQRLHARLAQWLIGQGPSSVGKYSAHIARHYALAADMIRAVKWYSLAARHAYETLQPERSIHYYEEAIDALPDNNDDMKLQIALYEGFGQVLHSQARYADALSAYTAVCLAAERLGDAIVQARAWNALVEIQINDDNAHEALYCARQAVQAAEKGGKFARIELGKSWLNTAQSYLALGFPHEGLPWAEKGYHLLQELNAASQIPRAKNLLAVLHASLHDYAQAQVLLEEALVLARQLSDHKLEGSILNELAAIKRFEGHYQASVQDLRAAMTLASATSSVRDMITYTNNLGAILVRTGQYQEAEIYLDEVLAMVGEAGWWGMVGTYRALAEIYLAQSRLDEASTAAHNTLTWAKRHSQAWDMGVAWQILGQVAAALHSDLEIEGEWLDAANCYERSYTVLLDHHELGELAHTLRLWALLEIHQGRASVGTQRWEVARDLYEQLGATAMVTSMDQQKEEEGF